MDIFLMRQGKQTAHFFNGIGLHHCLRHQIKMTGITGVGVAIDQTGFDPVGGKYLKESLGQWHHNQIDFF
jgi:hypothetical protein